MITPVTPGRACQPDPHQDQPGPAIPDGILQVLVLTRILIEYGHHLAALMPLGAVWSGFAAVARFLGGDTLAETLLRIQRGLLCAIALERVLLRRARRGRDIPISAPRLRLDRASTPDRRQASQPPAGSPHAAPQPGNDPGALPTLEDLEAEIRRRPIGRTLAAICLDLGVSPSLCTGWFWNHLFHAMIAYQGNLIGLLTELNRRQQRFEDTRIPPPGRPLPPPTCDAARQILGFHIGDPPTMPDWPPRQPHPSLLPSLATAGTGPP